MLVNADVAPRGNEAVISKPTTCGDLNETNCVDQIIIATTI